ncbi:YjiH family protein [Peptoniphilus equinus]|uniref:YjiH family protein n=1 Tax=Peptoniphilus equinus TaxID=3016343 RepID=A0ABY7QUS0_9FIRM|nr:YjiH family protein [Peptoniphilus equinus]WBW50025.1 YjiH family protein [Peptoniphilus equinus]
MDNKHKIYNSKNVLKFILISAIGIVMFFIQITVNGDTSIPVEMIVSWIQTHFMPLCRIYALIFIILGAILPYVKGTYKQNVTTMIFSVLKIVGAIASIGIFFNIAPKAVMDPDVGPYLFESLGVGLGVLIPICAIFISFLISYGLVDAVGMLIRPVTQAIWKRPGISAIDAISSFVGSSAMGIMITNGLFKEKKYTVKEAGIIVTGFSAVAITFMVVVAETLNLMSYWNVFFTSALLITFAVTALTARIDPIKSLPNTYYNNEAGAIEEVKEGNICKQALIEGLRVCSEARPIVENITIYLKDAMVLVLEYLPNLMSIGLMGLLLAEYTPVFDVLGYLFYPVTWLLHFSDPVLAAKATVLGLAEMYLPVLLVVDADIMTRFVVGIGSITGILMFSCTIPVILATEIKVSLKHLVIIWVERAVISLVLARLVGMLIFRTI